MGKNPQVEIFLLKQKLAEAQAQADYMKAFTIRQCVDVAMITLHQAFEFGPDRNERFETEFIENFIQMAQMVLDDGKDDEKLEWSIDRFDRLVREARGNVPPFKERYDNKNLYYKEKELKE